MLKGAVKDSPSVTREHALVREYLHGVDVHEVCNVVTRNGLMTEVYRSDWAPARPPPRQAIYVTLRPGAVSAWHLHRSQLDQIFVVAGALKLVLYDDREDSPTRGRVNEFHLDRARPCLISVPPGLWHGLAALGDAEASFVNFFDCLYDHQNPDEWRLPLDTDAIPYRF